MGGRGEEEKMRLRENGKCRIDNAEWPMEGAYIFILCFWHSDDGADIKLQKRVALLYLRILNYFRITILAVTTRSPACSLIKYRPLGR